MKSNRRNFFKAIGTIGITSTLAPLATYAKDPQANEFGFSSEPYLQNNNAKDVTVIVTFNKPAFAHLEILDHNNQVLNIIYEVQDGMRNANTDLFKFKVPHGNKNFKYRIIAKEVLKFEAYKIEYGPTIQSEIYETKLSIHDDREAHILILNDIHENTSTYSELYKLNTMPRTDLVLLNGDIFHYVNSKFDLINKLNQPISKAFASHIPFVLVRGNHETRGPFARELKNYYDFPNNKFYQSFSLGKLFIVILDGGEDKPDDHQVYGQTVDYDHYRLEQKEWLTKVLQSKERKKAKHTIIVNHIPWFHSDDWHGTLHNRECFHEIVQKAKVDAVISGHTHEYGFYPPANDHNYYVIIGGGPKAGSRTFVEISSTHVLTVNLKKDDNTLINTFTRG